MNNSKNSKALTIANALVRQFESSVILEGSKTELRNGGKEAAT